MIISFIFYFLGLNILQPFLKYKKLIKLAKKETQINLFGYYINEIFRLKPELINNVEKIKKDLKLNYKKDENESIDLSKSLKLDEIKNCIINLYSNYYNYEKEV